jgi:hypothetical protein
VERVIAAVVAVSAGVSVGAVLWARRRKRLSAPVLPVVLEGGITGPPLTTLPVPGKVVLKGF